MPRKITPFLVVVFVLSFTSAFSQVKDSLISKKPKKEKSEPDTGHSPKKAAIYSAILPGAGQVYNGKKQYWKVPIIYAGLGTCTYFAISNFSEYKKFRKEYSNRQNGITENYYLLSDDGVRVNRDYYRRYFEMSIMIGAGVYALNIIDAYVWAHLKEFDISPELAISPPRPLFYTNYNAELVTGMSVSIRLKK